MEKKVYGLLVNGEEHCLNAEGDICVSWSLAPCAEQKKYEITVFDGENAIARKSGEGVAQHATVGGLRLEPLGEYSVQVSVVTDCYGETSERAFFRAALINGFGSDAKWISNGSRFVEETEKAGSAAQYLKKVFYVEKPPKSAIINVCGLGMYELFINDKRVGDRVLEPAFTKYDKRVLYSTYEVAELLREGENVVEVILGDGWYNQTTRDTWGFFRAPWRDCPKLIFRMDGEGLHVVSDQSWSVSCGELISNAVRTGEFYDFSRVRDYRPVSLTPPPGGELCPSVLPPIRECETLLPVKVINGESCKIYDFGKNIAGYCSAVFAGKRGDLVYIEYSDRLNGDKLDNASNSMYIYNTARYQTDGCLLEDGANEYKPKFVYHGFRYVAVYTEAEIIGLKAHFVRTDLKERGRFHSSSQRLNTLYQMSINAILSNYHGFPTDCPHREKNGWTGDAQLSLEACVYNLDMKYAYEKWLNDFIDCQLPSGQISAIIPTCGWGYNWGSGPAWDIAFFRVLRALWYYYGDLCAVKRAYPALKKYYGYISGYCEGGLLCVGLGDWNYPKRIQFDICPTELTDSCYRMQMARMLSEFALLLGDGEDAERYLAEADAAMGAIAKKYSDEKSLTGLAALTYFGVADRAAEVVKYIEEHSYEPHFGILGCKFVLDVLGRAGRCDVGQKMLEKGGYPSFWYWAENGQTSLCEDFELTNSLNHHMYSPVAEFMTRYVCGVEIEKDFSTFTVTPCLPKDMQFATACVMTANGELKVSVRTENGKERITLEIPANVTVRCRGAVYRMGKHEI